MPVGSTLRATLTNCFTLQDDIDAALVAFGAPASTALGEEWATIYNGSVILMFHEKFAVSAEELRDLVEALYWIKQGDERVHHVVALECSDRGFDVQSVRWRCSAGEQEIAEHTRFVENLQACVEAHFALVDIGDE